MGFSQWRILFSSWSFSDHQSPASTSSSSFFTLSYNLQNPKRILPSLSFSHGVGVSVSRGGRSDGGEAGDGRVLRDRDRWVRDSRHRRVDGVRDPRLEEEIVGGSSSGVGGEQRDEAAEVRGDTEFSRYSCLLSEERVSPRRQSNEDPCLSSYHT